MKAVKATGGKAGAGAPSFSTSQGRANFARALETTDLQKTVVGFDRYNRPVAALVPIEAVSMLAGHSGDVEPAVRAKIVRMARLFLSGMTTKKKKRRPRRAPTAKRVRAKAARKKAAKRKTKARVTRRKGLGNGA
jgi:hypothetical protein